ncbi:DUF305 domain-containing protein [Gordonia rhizosphera]|uniref:DUF305 domain-containing protein n=1 Tax=Gordonia rhizosphera NBRC 16068 TaxID=1108045 RepID=K6WQR3_9ACTN|nr:DUF305 domain-containing protein [Gordonia rhizosphera]GAB88864.1 hypothetical protein GORHZ_046_00140 [Gordonia rhizosphera NBRC 16068]
MTARRVIAALGVVVAVTAALTIGGVLGAAWQDHRTSADRSHNPSATDIGFAQDMSVHHDQAILMGRSLSRDVAPDVSGLADRIVAAQTAEVARMRAMLLWFGAPLTSSTPMAWMTDASGHGHRTMGTSTSEEPRMEGMAGIGELTRLANLHGRAAEILFLQLMIRHHEGGLTMAVATHNDPTASETTRAMALTMIGEQGDEIGRMTMLLRDRGAQPLPHP